MSRVVIQYCAPPSALYLRQESPIWGRRNWLVYVDSPLKMAFNW